MEKKLKTIKNPFHNKGEIKGLDGLYSSLLATTAGFASSSLMMNEVFGKMFGNDKLDIQDTVRSIMMGVMDGMLLHFEGQIDDYKYKLKQANEEIGKLKEQNESLEEQLNAAREANTALAEKIKKKGK